jgi:serine protease Do
MRWSTILVATAAVLACVLAVASGLALAFRLAEPPVRPALDPRVQLTVPPIPTLPPLSMTPTLVPQSTPAAGKTPTAVPEGTTPVASQNPARAALGSVVQVRTDLAQGTGFVWERRGDLLLVVTAAHVLEDASRVSIIAPDGIEYRATVLQQSAAIDAALLAVNAGLGLEPLPRGDSLWLVPRHQLYVVGFALGTELLGDPTVTRGVLSGRRVFDGTAYLQTDAAMNPGNSGGSVLDGEGRVVGMAVGVIRQAQGVPIEGVNFALAVEELEALLEPFAR